MKSLLSFILLYTVAFSFAEGPLQVGDLAKHTDVKMKNVAGGEYSLADLKGANGLVVIFSCNTCPFVDAWESRYNDVKQWADNNGVGVAVLNSNHESRNNGDSFADMKKRAEEKGYLFPYLIDEESVIANASGGQTTPHVFLFDKDFRLVYKGAIDDNYKSPDKVSHTYLKDAIVGVANGSKIVVVETKPIGCSIKRKL